MAMRTAGRAAAGRSGRTFLVDNSATLETRDFHTDSTRYDFFHRVAGDRVGLQRFVIHTLEDLEAARLDVRIVWNRFINVGWHCLLNRLAVFYCSF